MENGRLRRPFLFYVTGENGRLPHTCFANEELEENAPPFSVDCF